jgi:sugar/nucleoside kinase (ribokinase family)
VPAKPPAPLVVVAGDVINDILVRPVSAVTRGSDTTSVINARPGGSAANQAAWLGHLGADVLFAGRCGARDADYHRTELARFGVDARLAADGEAGTGTIVIMVSPDGERTMFTDRGANLRLRRSDVPLPDSAACLHLTGYTFFEPSLLPVARSLVGDARSRGMAVTIDPGSAAYLEPLAAGGFFAWTSGAQVLFPNLDEAAVLTGESDPLTMAERLTSQYTVVAVKLGAGGCVLAVAGELPVQVPPIRVPAPGPGADALLDTTGAGDAFCAAFLSKWLGGAEPLDAATYAVRIAAEAVTRLGGRPAGPELT